MLTCLSHGFNVIDSPLLQKTGVLKLRELGKQRCVSG